MRVIEQQVVGLLQSKLPRNANQLHSDTISPSATMAVIPEGEEPRRMTVSGNIPPHSAIDYSHKVL